LNQKAFSIAAHIGELMISNDKSLVNLYGTSLSESTLAVRIDFGDKIVWTPKSLMEDWPDIKTSGEILVKEWFAKKEGLI